MTLETFSKVVYWPSKQGTTKFSGGEWGRITVITEKLKHLEQRKSPVDSYSTGELKLLKKLLTESHKHKSSTVMFILSKNILE